MRISKSIGNNNLYVITRIFGSIGIIVLIVSLLTIREPILFFIGLVFFAIGAIPELLRIKRAKQIAQLKEEGIVIKATFQNVEINNTLEVNGRSPFRIVCQWLDPQTREVYIFNSENLWYNPEPYITQQEFDILVMPKDYTTYYMDISHLPKIKS